MNRLWVRMQSPANSAVGAVKGRKRRERERQDLRLLVGAGLTRASALGGLTLPIYASEVLPRVLAEVGACADEIAQGYLMDSLIQVSNPC